MMSFESNNDSPAAPPFERQIIRVDNLPDQAGIAAALRRAFEAGRPSAEPAEDDMFAELLNRIH
jgi:hypothetical protein